MKKLLALVLAGVMAFSMVACGGGEAEGEGEGEGSDLLKVNFICTNLGDKSFNDSAHYGLQAFEDEGKIDYTVTEYGQDNAKVDITMEEAAEEGYDVITCNNLGFGMAAAWCRNNAANYPDTTFVIFDESIDVVDLPNVQMVAYKANEADFLAGALAAKLSKTGVIGFVGGQETPVIHDFLVGYIEGAKHVNPEIKVNVSYIGDYQNTAKGKDLGVTAIGAGADVLHAVAGSAGNGYLEAAKEAGVYGIGVDSDQYEVFKTDKPDLASCIVTSSLKEVGKSLVDICQQMIDGTYTRTECMWYGMDGAYCGLADNENYQKLVSEEIRNEITAIAEEMANGTITVSTAYGMPADTLTELVNSVK